jgi:protein-S-isoprenylcysteine O-methyltransferase Ste14
MSSPKTLHIARMPPVGWFALCLLAGYVVDRLRPAPLGPWLGSVRLPAAGALLAAAAFLGLWTLALFARHRTTPMPEGQPAALLTSGPFRVSRNPLYVAGVAAELAVGLFLDSGWIALSALPLFVALDRLVIPREEARLRATFGAAYAAYAARVRRWL